jgi:hypothetical protein
VTRLHVHAGLEVRFKLGFAELVDLFDEMTNVAKKNMKLVILLLFLKQ